MAHLKKLKTRRVRRQRRVRRRLRGDAERPRLSVHRSARHMYAQLIDDVSGHTMAAASTLESDLRDGKTSNCDAAAEVGKRLAEKAKAAGVTQARFDRGRYKFHGRVKALAEAAREAGLTF